MDWIQEDSRRIVGCYGRFPAVLVRGRGARVWDENGKEYIDFGSGIGVNSLGYCDEEWAKAVSKQAHTLQHTSNLYYTTPDIALADKLCAVTGCDKVFFANSGAEANEALLKIARKYSFDKYGKGRHTIITMKNSFHGRTMNTLTATGQDVFHNFFFPFAEGFRYAEPTMEGVLSQLDDTVCGILFEPIQGEGGVVPLEKDFVRALAKLCEEKDILLLCDEVQTGIGRTGRFLACEHFGVSPDVTSLAKGLGGGLPIGAVLCNEKTSGVLGPSHHGTTFGGNPVVCAGALVCARRIADPAFLTEVERKAQTIRASLANCAEVESVTGLGLMLGLRLKTKTAKQVASAALEAGLLVLTAKEKVRLLPPLTIRDAELEEGLNRLKHALG